MSHFLFEARLISLLVTSRSESFILWSFHFPCSQLIYTFKVDFLHYPYIVAQK